MHSADDWKNRGVLQKAIRARRMQKDQLRVAHTTPPSRSGRQASSRRPCCRKESAVASQLPNLAGRASAVSERANTGAAAVDAVAKRKLRRLWRAVPPPASRSSGIGKLPRPVGRAGLDLRVAARPG